ncbi:acetylxylan esterase [Catellatospora sp. NPDC049111]|uniref:acetylxylan esterase n=1 Tax=Catellatospora sp. NPDC049111 TaxID=3155271 RepID=UPI00340645D9
MHHTDPQLDHRPDVRPPADWERFWQDTLAETAQHPLAPVHERVDSGLRLIETYDTVFAGFGGAPIRAWLHLPACEPADPLPCVVEYIGYGGGRGMPHERVMWAAAGYAHLVMDSRGQGAVWAAGHTPDPAPAGGPAHPGFATRGITDPHGYYYRRLFTDAVRAVQAAAAHPRVDAGRVAVAGSSQGGALALAAAGLLPGLAAALVDVPFLAGIGHALRSATEGPYLEIIRYLAMHPGNEHAALRTLSYMDGSGFAARADAPALFSVGLMDPVCPPAGVDAAFLAYRGAKTIEVYRYSGHEGGHRAHEHKQLRWLRDVFGRPRPQPSVRLPGSTAG